MDWLVMVLRVVHIGGAVFWAGSAFTFFVFVAPSLEVLSPPSRKAFLDYVRANDLRGIEPFYSAYPKATVLDIHAALDQD